MSSIFDIEKVRFEVHEILCKLQYESGEFGKDCESLVTKENKFRHTKKNSSNIIHNRRIVRKPNCSISLIAALGIMSYKGKTDERVKKVYAWFTSSEYVSSGWFQQDLYQLDSDPFGTNSYSISVQDVRHTATALLGVLVLGTTCAFSTTALKNLTEENVLDRVHGGWVAIANLHVAANEFDFYTTIYMLASLKIINDEKLDLIYGIENKKISQLLNDGLNAICSKPPSKLGYNESIEQVLRANAMVLFFCPSLLYERNKNFMNQIIDFLLEKKTENSDEISWNDDVQTTINVIAGLLKCINFISNDKLDKVVNAIVGSLKYIITHNDSPDYRHPASLGFLLCICDDILQYSESKILNEESLDIRNLRTKIDLQIKCISEFFLRHPEREDICANILNQLNDVLSILSDEKLKECKETISKIQATIRFNFGDKYTIF